MLYTTIRYINQICLLTLYGVEIKHATLAGHGTVGVHGAA